MSLFSHAPESICILRLSAIGDCVHTVAVVQAIQRQWPHTRITWIMGKVEAMLLGDLPGVEVIPFDKKLGWRGYRQVWRQLKGRRFDALLHMQSALRASLLSLGIRATHKLGFDAQRAGDGQRWFTNHAVPSPASPHVLDGLMAFAAELGITDLEAHWQIPTSAADDAWASAHLDNARPTLVIAPAASKAYKNWTVAGYAALADHAAACGFQVLLCGGPTPLERQMASEIMALCQHQPGNLIGQTSLKQLMALIKQAQLVLAPDTGPTHMATAAGVPVIGLYAHHNPERTGPYRCRDWVVSVYQQLMEAHTGRPLAELPWRSRLKDPDAMQQITPQQVIHQFNAIAQAHGLLKDPE